MYYINLSNPLDKRIKFENQTKIAEQIGIAKETLSRILSGKQGASKKMAYCITKAYNNKAEILEYFEYEGE